MECNEDDTTRCLPKFPKLFTPSPQSELILFPEHDDAGNLSRNGAGHEATASADVDVAKERQNDAQIETIPVDVLYSSLNPEAIEEHAAPVNSLLLASDLEEKHPGDDIPDDAVEELSEIVAVARKSGVEVLGKEEDNLFGQRTPDKGSPEAHADTPESLDQPPQPLTKSRLRSIPEAKLYTLEALPHQLQESSSKATTTGSDTPRLAELDAESVSTFEAPEQSLGSESQAHYTPGPRSRDSTYHSYQGSNTEDGYKTERVPFQVASPEMGASTHRIAVSEKDQVVSRQNNHETLWRHNSKDGPVFFLRSESPAFHRSDTGSDDMINVGYAASDELVKRVSDRLRTIRHLREHLQMIDGKGKHITEADGLYLVGDKDIRDVVKIVMEETQKSSTVVEPKRKSTKGSAGSRSLPRLDEASNAIIPPSVTVANPATTISLPRTSYTNINANDMQVHTKTRGAESDATAVISHQSVSEITWAQKYPPGYDSPTGSQGRAVSDCFSPTHGALVLCSEDRRQSHPVMVKGEFVFRHYTSSKSTAEILAGIICDKSSGKQQRVSEGTVITSFPKLRPRHCTNEWLTPPMSIEDLNQPSPSTLYRQGVDAHCGTETTIPSGSSGEPPKPRQCGRSLFGGNPFGSRPNAGPLEASGFAETLAAEKRLSTSLSIDFQRRYSTQVAGIESEGTEAHGRLRPSLMDRIRQGGHKIFHRHHSHKSTEVPRVTTELEEPLASAEPPSRDSIVIKNTLKPPRPDRAGIYEAMTGTRLTVTRQRHDTCSEDNRPHMCEDNILTPSRTGSPA
ncbi:hypothetical protein NM208_g15215 [Fusarium decemcellulare]|uniref:Uncharacterized protein n=1 Tax=Fusarium decemcellulare TaxID=57161 RepID=A0ACC1RFH9_9HYPO|nr:hypothetical protein NM208_g15215 [Fusarium decemcellulare]